MKKSLEIRDKNLNIIVDGKLAFEIKLLCNKKEVPIYTIEEPEQEPLKIICSCTPSEFPEGLVKWHS